MANTYVLIASNVLAANALSVTFSSIPSTYTDLVIKASTRDTNAAAGNGPFYLRFNGDFSTSYSDLNLRTINGNTVVSASIINSGAITVGSGVLDSGGNTSNTFTNIELYIPNYTSTINKPISSFATSENAAVGNIYIGPSAHLYRNTISISSLTISATQFATNSSFYLYGIKKN